MPLPSTGSHHVLSVVTLQLPLVMLPSSTPHWALLNWQAVGQVLLAFTFSVCQSKSTANTLCRWFDIFSTSPTPLLTSHAPGKWPCPSLKPLWSPRLSALKWEYHRFAQISGLTRLPLPRAILDAQEVHTSRPLHRPRSITGRTFCYRPPLKTSGQPQGFHLAVRPQGFQPCQMLTNPPTWRKRSLLTSSSESPHHLYFSTLYAMGTTPL